MFIQILYICSLLTNVYEMKTKTILTTISLSLLSVFAFAQTQKKSAAKHLPIIDVHVHAMKVNPNYAADMSPWFLSNMPGADPNSPAPSFQNTEGAILLKAAKSDKEFEEELVKILNRLNISMIACGDPQIMRNWEKAAPGRVIPSIGFGDGITPEAFEDSLKSGYYKVVGEVAPQYRGISPSDPSFDKFYAIAEKYNMPVAIHMGTGGNGMANLTQPKFRASVGNPLLLEDVLAKYPKLKISVMHAGYPFLEEMIALMGANAYVYVDIAGLIWSYPLDEIHYYIKRLVQAGFGKRIMYGTDLMMWPSLVEISIGVIDNAQYLSFDQKRDILFNNAVRFFRLDPEKFQ